MRDGINTASLSIFRFIAAIIVILYHHRKGSEILQDAPAALTAGPTDRSLSFLFCQVSYWFSHIMIKINFH